MKEVRAYVKGLAMQSSNMTNSEISGLKKGVKIIGNRETDEYRKLAVVSEEKQQRMGDEHVQDNPISTCEEINKCQRSILGPLKCFNLGDATPTKNRVLEM